MIEIDPETPVCPECGVPIGITSEHLWLNNGEFVQLRRQDGRLAFLECENLDPLYKIIGEIIGMPVEHMIINATARGLRAYLSEFMPKETISLLRSMTPGNEALEKQCRQILDGLSQASIMIAKINGTGRYEGKEYRYENDLSDFSRTWIYEPYSIPFVVGSLMGNTAALVGGHHEVEYHQILHDVWEINSRRVAETDTELNERLSFTPFVHREGDIELEGCSSCSGPASLSHFKWHLDRGVVINTLTGRRMAILGPTLLDRVFEELEVELGDTIPRTIVEAQRRFVKTGFYSIEEVQDEGDMREQFALRGLGNLKEIKVGAKGVRARVDSAILHLIIVGLIQGLFEMAFDIESYAEWEYSGEGDLTVEVRPKGIA